MDPYGHYGPGNSGYGPGHSGYGYSGGFASASEPMYQHHEDGQRQGGAAYQMYGDGQAQEPFLQAYDGHGPADSPSPEMITIDALLAEPVSEDGRKADNSDGGDSKSSSSDSDSDPDSDSASDSGGVDDESDIQPESESDDGLSGSGDDYVDEEELERRAVARAKAKEAALKLAKRGKKQSEKKSKATAKARARAKAKAATGTKGKPKAKIKKRDGASVGGKKKKDGGDAVFDMIAESVSKAGTGQELGVDDTRFQEMMADIDDDDEDLLATGRAQKRTREHRPTPEVARLLGEANAAYAVHGPAEGLEIYLQVVRHDQLLPQAWSSLASCYEELGRGEAARQMRLCAAHVDRDGDKWASLAAEFKELGQMNQCLYCLTQALRIDPSDVEALWELATIHRDQGNNLKAVKAFQRIVKHDPESANNFTLLQEFYPLIQETRQYNFGAQAYRNAFDYHLETYAGPFDPDADDEGDEEGEGNTMELQHILCLVDMLSSIEKLEEGVDVVRRGMRWLQGRTEQKYWDTFDDDREYSTDPKIEEAYELDVTLRHRLALLRLRLGNDADAFMHVDEITQLDVAAYQEMYVELGQTLMKRELWEKALLCYADLNQEETIDDDVETIYSLGVCLHECDRQADAVEYLNWVIKQDPDHLEARVRLANVLEDMGKQAEALEIITDVLRRRAQQGQERRAQPRQSRGDKAAERTLTKRMLESQMRSTMVSLWEEVLDAERMLDDGDVGALEMFIQAAGTMIDNHRMAKHMFKRDKGVKRMTRARFKNLGLGLKPGSDVLAIQDRLERSLGLEANNDGLPNTVAVRMTEFYGLSREDWLSLVIKIYAHVQSEANIQYCCVLMATNENEVALEILEQMVYSAIFYSRRCEIALRLAIVASATRSKAYQKVADNCRRLSQMHQFRLEPILLLQSALQGGGTAAHNVWCTLALQRFIHRELQLYEDAIEGQGLIFSKRHQRWTMPPKVGISRLLDEDLFFDGDERKGDEDDDAPAKRGKKAAAAAAPRKSTKAVAADATLGDVLVEEEGVEGDDDEDMPEGEEDEEDRETARPTRVSPAWCAVYGQYMLSSGSYHGALYYLLRAYEIDPYDSYICLMIAQAFFGRSMNRQSDNRNYQIAQGLAFLTKYRKMALVTRDPQTVEEVEYNYGRSFHGIGVPHLAVVHYERVLDSVRKRMDAEEHDDLKDDVRRNSLACGAAHNLMLLYAATGSMDLANETSKWLAI